MLIAEFVIVQTVVFLIVFIVLRRMMVRNTMSAVNRMKRVDEENAQRLEEMKKKVEEAEGQYQQKSAELAFALEEQREAAKKQIEEDRNKLLGEAREESERILGSARNRSEKIDHERGKEAQVRLINLAGQMIQAVLSEQMKMALNEQLVDELLQEFEVQDIGQLPEQTKEAKVVLPHPLSPNCRRKIEKILENKVGRKIDLREAVKKDMVGGIILSIDSLMMDGSLENKLDLIVRDLKKQI